MTVATHIEANKIGSELIGQTGCMVAKKSSFPLQFAHMCQNDHFIRNTRSTCTM